MFITQHAQDRFYERTGLYMFKREIGWLADRAKQVRGSPMKIRACEICGNRVCFVCRKRKVVTVIV